MDLFDDALSEDWISQPGSGPPSVHNENLASSLRGTLDSSSRNPQRQPKQGSARFLQSRRIGSGREYALSEKRPSQLNARKSNSSTSSVKGATVQYDSSTSSARSAPSVRRGTVLQTGKAREDKSTDRATPEWRQRLLEGKGESGHKDLFSPIGLENVFEPPNNLAAASGEKGKKQTSGSIVPSAEPAFPTTFTNPKYRETSAEANIGRLGCNRSSMGREEAPDLEPENRYAIAQKRASVKDAKAIVEANDQLDFNDPSENASKATSDLRSLVNEFQNHNLSDGDSQWNYPDERQHNITMTRGNELSGISSLEQLSEEDILLPLRVDGPNFAKTESISRPTTPKISGSPTRSVGSPLKLFGIYDTYTNNRLERRVTQLEVDKHSSGTHTTRGSYLVTQKEDIEDQDKLVQRLGTRKSRIVSSFGVGELDRYTFDHADNSAVELKAQQLRAVTSRSVSYSYDPRAPWEEPLVVDRPAEDSTAGLPRDPYDLTNDEGKRLPLSPRRTPKPKRRRTSLPLPNSVDGTLERAATQSQDYGQYVADQKCRLAHYDGTFPTASPEVIASRHILQPKVPYSATRRSISTAKHSIVTTNRGNPENVPAFPVSQLIEVVDTEEHSEAVQELRKKSVTTADFFKEANLIMRNIRAQAQSPISHITRDCTEDDFSQDATHLYNEEFTMEQLSRPASREGSYRRRPPHGRVLNARVVSHLRKYEERDEGEIALASSVDSPDKIDTDSLPLSDGIHSDPPNIRIRDHIKNDNSPKASSGTHHSLGSSSSQPTEKSLPTNSSGSSAPRATISPEKVSHLLSRTMGCMTFDESKGCWVKTRLLGQASSSKDELADNDSNDGDPFQAIPDLTIDESQEILAVRGIIRRPSTTKSNHENIQILARETPRKYTATSDLPGDEPSSAVSKCTRFASSGPIIETRATSWGDTALQRNQTGSGYPKMPKQMECFTKPNTLETTSLDVLPALYPASEVSSEQASQVTRSITPTNQASSTYQASITARPHTIVDHIRVDEQPTLGPSERQLQYTAAENRVSALISEYEGPEASDDACDFACAPSAGDLQLAVSTPHVQSRIDGNFSPLPGALACMEDLQLTPLPDFTINQPDESLQLDVSYVAQYHGVSTRDAISGKFSLAIRELVDRITNVEPYEPYWEFLRKLDLHKCSLLTLHMLSEFCSRVEHLDVSGNELGQLNGVPQTLRLLNVRNNHLSSLTAWNHLPNLQYLDISGNNVTSLKALTNLIHLRELNAESNQIEETDGIWCMDNLISLKLGHNRLTILDCSKADLPHLTLLDVHSNQIDYVDGLAQLSSLQELSLRDNNLKHFTFGYQSLPRTLQHLDLSVNELNSLDLTDAPSLKSLAVDRNNIQVLDALDALRSMETISWSNQGPSKHEEKTLIQFECCSQVQFLNLCGNNLTKFVLQVPFLNLRRLELASCGLEVLSQDFGSYMPNMRVINLNDNGLKDIRPLLGIVQLEELYIARNRISRLRLTTTALKHFGSTLRIVDIRENPLTLGFYPPPRTDQLTNEVGMGVSEHDAGLEALCRDCDRSSSLVALNMLPTDENRDHDYQTRLDEETLLRRRVYEALILCHCAALESWDGMAVDRRRFIDGESTWNRLVDLGVLRKK